MRMELTDNGSYPFNITGGAPQRLAAAHGTWGGGALKLQRSAGMAVGAGAEKFFDVAGATWAAADALIALTLPTGRYQWVLSGATGPSIVADLSE